MQVSIRQETHYRPMDLRAARAGAPAAAAAAAEEACSSSRERWVAALRVASSIAAEARAAVKAETGFRTSAGISCSKMLAKLVSGMHKPNDQTLMLPPDAPAFVATLPVRAIPGVGYKLEKELARMGVQTANDLRGVPRAALLRELGERTGQYVFGACRGEDPTPVQQSGPPKSITVEDSFKSCTSLAAAQHVLRILAPDLLARLREDAEEHARRPGSMTLKWRLRAQGWARTSASCPMPVQVWQQDDIKVPSAGEGCNAKDALHAHSGSTRQSSRRRRWWPRRCRC